MSDQLTGSAKLVGPIVRLAKQKIIQATTIDVLGERCSVRLSGNGALLTGLFYTGVAPKKGQVVQVDYRSGVPRVLTVSSDLAEEIRGIVGTQFTNQSQAAYNQPPGPPLQGSTEIQLSVSDGATITPSVYQIIFPASSVTAEEDGVVSIEFPRPEQYMYEVGVTDKPLNWGSAYIEGSLAVVDGVYTWVAQEDGEISDVSIFVKTPGSSGFTTVDILKNGTTIYPTSTMPEFSHTDTIPVFGFIPDVVSFLKGDIFSLDITGIATGSSTLIVSLKALGYSEISWLTDEIGEIMTETL